MTTKLEDLPKIGTTTANKLRDKGFEYAEDLPNTEEALKDLSLTDSQVEAVLAFHASSLETVAPIEEKPVDQETSDLQEVTFKILSGPHRNRVFTWKKPNPSGRFQDGLYVSLSVIGVNARTDQPKDGVTVFNFTYGHTVGAAELPTNEFEFFRGEVLKKSHTLPGNKPRVG